VVDGESPAPPELSLAWQCKRWGCLPDTGAYLDQDYVLLRRMTALSNIYDAYSRYRNLQGTQIHSLSENERRVLRSLKDMGILFGA
jgi:hypothetical protein